MLGSSLLVYGGLVSWSYFVYHTSYIFKFPPQLWRLVSSFLITGPQLDIILDPFFRRLS